MTRCWTLYLDSGLTCRGQLFVRLLAPLEYVEFDENKCHQPQECIPKVDEVPFDAPVNRCVEQCRVKDNFHGAANAKRPTLEAVVFLQSNIDLELEHQ